MRIDVDGERHLGNLLAVLGGRRLLALMLVVLGMAAPAYGATPSQSWRGAADTTGFEAQASRIASALAGRSVSIECADEATWRSLAALHGFDPVTTWGMTPLHWDSAAGSRVPDGYANLSPRACRFANAFLAKPTERGARLCKHGTRTVGARRGEKRGARISVFGECDDWGAKLMAIHVLGHESMHLAGVIDEAQADCLAVQIDAFVAKELGASATFARSLAREDWTDYYQSQDQPYRSRDCRNAGPLDLFRDSQGWPTPTAYSANLSARIRSFAIAPSADK